MSKDLLHTPESPNPLRGIIALSRKSEWFRELWDKVDAVFDPTEKIMKEVLWGKEKLLTDDEKKQVEEFLVLMEDVKGRVWKRERETNREIQRRMQEADNEVEA